MRAKFFWHGTLNGIFLPMTEEELEGVWIVDPLEKKPPRRSE